MFNSRVPIIFLCLNFVLGCASQPKQTAANDLQQKYLAQQKTIEILKEENSFLKSTNPRQLRLRRQLNPKPTNQTKIKLSLNQNYQQLRQAEREFQNKNWLKVLKLTELIVNSTSPSTVKSEAFLLRGQSFRRMGLADQAKQCFEQSLASSPDNQVKRMVQSELSDLDFLRSKQRASNE